jgi:PAS domain S-box-containing protein
MTGPFEAGGAGQAETDSAAARVRGHDWAATPLGPMQDWPVALRTSVETVLAGGFPMVLFWGPERTVVACNDAYLPLLGDKAEALGRDFLEVWSEAREVIGPEIERARQGKPSARLTAPFELHRKGEDIEQAWFDYQFSPVRGDDGSVEGVLTIAVEATERVQAIMASEEAAAARLQASELRFDKMADVVPAILWIVGADGRIGFFNRQWEAYTGSPINVSTPAEVARDYVHPDDAEETMARFGEAQRTGAFEVEHRIRSKTGAWRWFLVRAKAHRDPRTGEIDCWFGASTDIHDRKIAEEELRASEARYRSLFHAIDAGFCVIEVRLGGPGERIDYRVVEANPGFYEKTGFAHEILGKWLRKAAPDLEEHWYEAYGRVARTGEPVRFENGSDMLGRWFDVYAFRIDDPREGRVAILFNDISERKRQEEQTEMLMREVNHRSKNLLGVINAVAQHTAASGTEDFLARFGERVRALAASQDLLVQHAWGTVPLTDLVRTQLAHFSDLLDDRIAIEGPPLLLTPEATQSLSMVIHELATNAAKYGALSNETGRIAITWSVDETAPEPEFTIRWVERGGPPVSQPDRPGFGSQVTTRMAEASSGGTVTLDYPAEGLVWQLSGPAAKMLDCAARGRVAEAAGAGEAAAAPGRETRADAGGQAGEAPAAEGAASILVVEDEPLVAEALASMLTDSGYTVLGPVGNVTAALALLDRGGCDAAVLDVHLGQETSEPIAARLAAEGTPFVVASAYSQTQLAEVFRPVPLVGKPVQQAELTARLRQELSGGDTAP